MLHSKIHSPLHQMLFFYRNDALFRTNDCKYFTARHSITLDSVTGTCGWQNLEVCPSFNVRCPRSSPRTIFENNNNKKKNHRSSSYDFFQSFLGFLFLGDLFTVSSSCKKVICVNINKRKQNLNIPLITILRKSMENPFSLLH